MAVLQWQYFNGSASMAVLQWQYLNGSTSIAVLQRQHFNGRTTLKGRDSSAETLAYAKETLQKNS
jgi:hypothetical protein